MWQFQDCADGPVLERKDGGCTFQLHLEVSHIGVSEGQLGVCGRLVHRL